MGKLLQVFIIGGLIRFLLPTFIPSITTTLSSTVELNTPITSFKSLLEAIYFWNHDIDLYDGGVNHHPPLLVIMASWISFFATVVRLVQFGVHGYGFINSLEDSTTQQVVQQFA